MHIPDAIPHINARNARSCVDQAQFTKERFAEVNTVVQEYT